MSAKSKAMQIPDSLLRHYGGIIHFDKTHLLLIACYDFGIGADAAEEEEASKARIQGISEARKSKR